MSAEDKAIGMYTELFGFAPAAVTKLAGAGSNRHYFRLTPPENVCAVPTVIATIGTDIAENHAFVALARHFATKKLPVPEIYSVAPDGMSYLQQDLGDKSLFSFLSRGTSSGVFDGETSGLLHASMRMLAEVQNFGAEELDWKLCCQQAMDGRMIRWDLNYFKYCFLKQVLPEFSESQLEDEFNRLYEKLLHRAQNADTFMIRDFQSRNVMIAGGIPFLIDFQGGRRGPVEYDVASFLWQAKAGIPAAVRNELIDSYVKHSIALNPDFDETAFRRYLPYFVLFRILQTLGAYGYRGLSEGKPHFLTSIPSALSNLETHMSDCGMAQEFPYLTELARQLPASPRIRETFMRMSVNPFNGLTVTVASFSYKKGIPVDFSGNGGGFVFDCRAVHNPGRYEQYKPLTGRDKAVKDFLENDGEIASFLEHAWSLVDASVNRYIKRAFDSLAVNFGCTGGRHRSVYSAEATARHIAECFPQVRVILCHREQGIFEVIPPSI